MSELSINREFDKIRQNDFLSKIFTFIGSEMLSFSIYDVRRFGISYKIVGELVGP